MINDVMIKMVEELPEEKKQLVNEKTKQIKEILGDDREIAGIVMALIGLDMQSYDNET
jgi:phenylpyruvate tautomerase PptA (4-oxalocrotonate tautomerase family)